MEATKPELLAENLARLESLLAVSNATMQTIYNRLKEYEKTEDIFCGDIFSFAGGADAAFGLMEIFSDMLGIVHGTQQECLQ